MARYKWSCDSVQKKIYAVSEREMNQKLADLWELLLTSKSQLSSSAPKSLIQTKEIANRLLLTKGQDDD